MAAVWVLRLYWNAGSLTFEPFRVDLFDEVGVNVSRDEPRLSDDVTQYRDVVIYTWYQWNQQLSESREHAMSKYMYAHCMKVRDCVNILFSPHL